MSAGVGTMGGSVLWGSATPVTLLRKDLTH